VTIGAWSVKGGRIVQACKRRVRVLEMDGKMVREWVLEDGQIVGVA
jgi:hypothetical protein